MSRKKTLAVIGLVAIIHFGLMITLFISRMSCAMQPDCANWAAEILRDALAFPLNVAALALDKMGVDSDDLIQCYLHGEIVVVFLLNSLLASLIIWFVVMDPLMRAVDRGRHRTAGPQ